MSLLEESAGDGTTEQRGQTAVTEQSNMHRVQIHNRQRQRERERERDGRWPQILPPSKSKKDKSPRFRVIFVTFSGC